MTYSLSVSVKGIVLEDDGVWLRKNERDEWELPGGRMEPEEQPEQTVIREISEELGFIVEVSDIIQAHLYRIATENSTSGGVLVITYACKLIEKNGQFELSGEAGQSAFKNFPIREVVNLKMPEFYKAAILQASQKLK